MTADHPYLPPADPPPHQTVPSPPFTPRKPFPGILGAIGLCLLFLAIQTFGGIAFAVIMVLIGGIQTAESTSMLAMGPINIVAFAITMGAGVMFGRLRWSEATPMPPFPGLVLLPTAIAVLGIGILASELDNITRFILPMPDFIAKLMEDMASGGIAVAFALVVVAPLTEELLFRGLILQGFLKRYNQIIAILVSSLLFTLIHLNPYQFASAWLMGIFLAWLFIRTRSLWPCLFAHALFNSQVIIIPILRDHFGLQISGYTGPPADGLVQFQPLWFNLIGAVLVTLGVWGTAMVCASGERQSPAD